MTTLSDLTPNFRSVRLLLAREKGHPAGEAQSGYDILLPLDEDARILFDTTQVDGDGRAGHDLPVFSEGGSRSGHSRPDGWRELDNFAPTVVSQDTYVQYEDTTVSYQAL